MAEARQRAALRTGRHTEASRPVLCRAFLLTPPRLPRRLPAATPVAIAGPEAVTPGGAMGETGRESRGEADSPHLAALPSSGGLPAAPVRIGRSLRPPLPPFLLFPPPRGGFRPSSFLGERGSSLKRGKKKKEERKRERKSQVASPTSPGPAAAPHS